MRKTKKRRDVSPGVMRELVGQASSINLFQLPRQGLELPSNSQEDLSFSNEGGAKSGALDFISELWADLPEAVRVTIMALANAATIRSSIVAKQER